MSKELVLSPNNESSQVSDSNPLPHDPVSDDISPISSGDEGAVSPSLEKKLSQEPPYNPHLKILGKKHVAMVLNENGLPGMQPRNINLYRTAMVHRSYCTRKNQNVVSGNQDCPPGCLPLQEESYERLEFLGDSIISACISTYVFERFPDKDNEGFMSRLRGKLVSGKMLAFLCTRTRLPEFIIVSKQIQANGIPFNILEDVFEAFVGALYIDTLDITKCYLFVSSLIERHVDFVQLVVDCCSRT